jgi:hypothetical protein
MYLLFKSVEQRQLGIVKVIGTWMEFSIGYVPDTHTDIIEFRHLNPKIISEEVAWAWMYIGAYRGSISVRTGTSQNERLQLLSSHEATGEKTKYELTAEDTANTVLIMQAILRMKVDDIYDKRMVQLNMGVSDLELSSWDRQKTEAQKYITGDTASQPLLSALADARGITLEVMVNKVLTAVTNHNDKIAELLTQKHEVETDIKACQSIADVTRLMHHRFELDMPQRQRDDEKVDYASTFRV